MGRFAELARKKLEQEGKFVPLDLNEENVQALFKKCLATPQTKEEVKTILFKITNRIFRKFSINYI